MDGVAVILELLAANSGVTDIVPSDRIEAGVLPPGTANDAIGVESVSSSDRNIMTPGANRRVSERVQVTAMAGSYPRKKAILEAIKKACADFIGDAAGLTEVTVQTAGTGPDVMDEQASIFIGSRDFMVGFTEAR